MLSDYMLDKVLDKIKETRGIKNFCETRNLIDRDDKLTDYNNFKKYYDINNMYH